MAYERTRVHWNVVTGTEAERKFDKENLAKTE